MSQSTHQAAMDRGDRAIALFERVGFAARRVLPIAVQAYRSARNQAPTYDAYRVAYQRECQAARAAVLAKQPHADHFLAQGARPVMGIYR